MTIQLIRATASGREQLQLVSPYHPELPARAKAIGGKFSSFQSAWYFDVRDEERVRQFCVDIYGIDPLGPPPALVTVRVALDDVDTNTPSLWLGGREVASRRFRDSRVQTGEGVIVINGGFAASGGSAKYPSIAPLAGTVVEVRDLPETLVPRLQERLGDALTVVEEARPASTPCPESRTLARIKELLLEADRLRKTLSGEDTEQLLAWLMDWNTEEETR